MRQPWMVGRAVPCPPLDGGATLIALPMPDGGQRTARPTAIAGLLLIHETATASSIPVAAISLSKSPVCSCAG
jgi:hypothetical protein